MARTMKAAVVEQFGQPLRLQELLISTRGPRQVLIQAAASGVCHTDLHGADGDWPVKPALPFIPGREGAGVVAAIGSGVKHLKLGGGGNSLATQRLRALRILPLRLGDTLLDPAELGLLRERDLRGLCRGTGGLGRKDSYQTCPYRNGSDSLRGRNHI